MKVKKGDLTHVWNWSEYTNSARSITEGRCQSVRVIYSEGSLSDANLGMWGVFFVIGFCTFFTMVLGKMTSKLPREVRGLISQFYNWNWTLETAFIKELDKSILSRGLDSGSDMQGSFWSMLTRIEWWLHLLRTDGRNWRLPLEAERLLDEMESLNLRGMVETFSELLEYNRYFFDEPPSS